MYLSPHCLGCAHNDVDTCIYTDDLTNEAHNSDDIIYKPHYNFVNMKRLHKSNQY